MVPIGLPFTAASESSPTYRHLDVGMIVPCDDSVITVFTTDGDVGEP